MLGTCGRKQQVDRVISREMIWMEWMRHSQPETFGFGTVALCALMGQLHSMRAAYESAVGRRGGYAKDPGSAQSENRCTNWWCQRTSVCVLVRREGISLDAKEDGVRLRQHIPREPAKAGTVAGLFLSAKPHPLFLPVSLLVHLTAPM